MTDTGHKRKRPPTFQHYPTKRAKKLKKAWVETAKIKSKWRAQKRREGIESLRAGIPPQEREDPRRDVDSAGEDTDDEGSEDNCSDSELSLNEDSHPNASSDDTANESINEETAHLPPPPPHQPRQPKGQPLKKKYSRDNKSEKRHLARDKNNTDTKGATGNVDDKPSLRALFQKAYSKSSLHTYKSDPPRKRRGEHASGGRGGRGGAAASTRGRGQPDMKLRMNAMLEKIKRDFS